MAASSPEAHRAMLAKSLVMRWLAFAVIVGSMLPFLVNWVSKFAAGKPHGFNDIFGQGELLLTCFALSAVSLGELFGRHSSPSLTTREIWAAAASITVIAVSVMGYVLAIATDVSRTMVSIASIFLFASTLAAAWACVYAAAREEG
jgi:small-conductance mechanosensitive channel